MTSYFTHGLVILTLDGVTSFLKVLDILKICLLAQTFQRAFKDGGIFIDPELIVYIFDLVCVRI